MGKNRSSKGLSVGSVSNDIQSLCKYYGYELGEDSFGNISVYDRENDTELVITPIFMDMLEYNEELYQEMTGNSIEYLKQIVTAYHDAPSILKKANQFIMFDDASNHQNFKKESSWLAYHQDFFSEGHGILMSDRILTPRVEIPFILYHEMAHGLDFTTVNGFERYAGSHSIHNLIDKYGSATAYSKDRYGKGFDSVDTKYREDFAEIIGIVSAYKNNPDFKVNDVDGKIVSARKWVENHEELYEWGLNYVGSMSVDELEIPSLYPVPDMFD